MKASDFFNDILTTHLGFDVADERVAAIVKQTATLELPDGAETLFHEKFMTADVAKTKLKPTFFQEYAKQSEEAMKRSLTAQGFDESEISTILAEQGNIFTKKEKAFQALADKLKKAQKSGNDKAVQELEKQIADLNAKIETEKQKAIEPYTAKLAAMEGRLAREFEMREFGAVKTDIDLPEAVKVEAIEAALRVQLAKYNGDYSFDSETGQVKLFKKGEPETPLYIENKPADFGTIKTLALQESKLVGANPGGGSSGGNGHQGQFVADPNNGGGQGKPENRYVADAFKNAAAAIQTFQ